MTTNKDMFEFLFHEIACHPEIQSITKEDLKAHESDFDFWEELNEYLDCLRICDECHRPMIEGFCIDDGREHYCSENCLHRQYSEEEYKAMYNDGEGNSYWTVWWE